MLRSMRRLTRSQELIVTVSISTTLGSAIASFHTLSWSSSGSFGNRWNSVAPGVGWAAFGEDAERICPAAASGMIEADMVNGSNGTDD